MKKAMGIIAVFTAILMIAAMFSACGENNNSGGADYDGAYTLTEISDGTTTLDKASIEQAGAGITLTISGDKASMKGANGETEDLQFDANTKTFTANGDTVQATFDGNKCIMEKDGRKMVFEK